MMGVERLWCSALWVWEGCEGTEGTLELLRGRQGTCRVMLWWEGGVIQRGGGTAVRGDTIM